MPQSSNIFFPLFRETICFVPVTVLAAPWKDNFIDYVGKLSAVAKFIPESKNQAVALFSDILFELLASCFVYFYMLIRKSTLLGYLFLSLVLAAGSCSKKQHMPAN